MPDQPKLERVGEPDFTRRAKQQCVRRPPERGEGANRDQRVHGRIAVLQVQQRCPMEWPGTPDHHYAGQSERDPLPPRKLPGRNHSDHHHRQAQCSRNDQPAAQLAQFKIGVPRTLGRQRRTVTGLLDRLDQGLRRGAAGCVDRRLLRRVIDGGVDTFESVELLLDSGGTGCAGHALNVELNGLNRHA